MIVVIPDNTHLLYRSTNLSFSNILTTVLLYDISVARQTQKNQYRALRNVLMIMLLAMTESLPTLHMRCNGTEKYKCNNNMSPE